MKKMWFVFAIVASTFIFSNPTSCFAGHEDITLSPAEEMQDGIKDRVQGKIPMTRTLIHGELPFDTQCRTKVYKLTDKHLGKRITIKVRTAEDCKQNDIYQDPMVRGEEYDDLGQSVDYGHRVMVNGKCVIQAHDRKKILNTVMEHIENLKSNPEHRIIVE